MLNKDIQLKEAVDIIEALAIIKGQVIYGKKRTAL